jgi:hypothetical protein
MSTAPVWLARHTTLFAALALTSLATQAAGVSPVSYDTPNGDGNAHGGSYNYWDQAYTGSGATSTDRSALTGGLGDLTDGVIASQNWYAIENNAGTGPYVGWFDLDPTLTLHFGQAVHITSITLHADDADGSGGVYAPGGITIGGSNHSFLDPVGSAPNVFTVTGLDITTSDLSFTLHRRFSGTWLFVSEITTDAAAAVPEPSTWALGLLGLITTWGWSAAKQRQQVTRRKARLG